MKTITIVLLSFILTAGITDAQDHLNVEWVGSCTTSTSAKDVVVVGNFAYVAGNARGLRVVDVSNPATPIEVGSCQMPGYAWGLAVRGNYAYVAAYVEGGLRVVDISNPAAPVQAGSFDTRGTAVGVAVAGDYAYVADIAGLDVINIANPDSIFETGYVYLNAPARRVVIWGGVAYVAADTRGLKVLNIADPHAPYEAWGWGTPTPSHDLAVNGDYVFMAVYQNGIYGINSPPYGYNTPGHAVGVVMRGSFLYVADLEMGLRILSIANPNSIVETGFYDTFGDASKVFVSGDYAYVADGDNGLGIYDCTLATATMGILEPNGGEVWQIFHSDTVRWVTSDSATGLLRIELNRDYPNGNWEVLADSTDNDGQEAVFLTPPLSNRCRVRISGEISVYHDTSQANFTISSSQGYLALAKSSDPDISCGAWNAGTVECPATARTTFRLKNFGSQSIKAFRPLEPVSTSFSVATTCADSFVLAPGQMSACSLRLTFDPASDGFFRDTLLIQTDAVNGVNGYVRIPLSGTQISTPALPQIVIQAQGEDAHLTWQPVMQSVGGCPVSVARYLVFYSPTVGGPFYYHGYTTGTSYTHYGVVTYADGMFYQVIAHSGSTVALEQMPTDGSATEEEVLSKLAKE